MKLGGMLELNSIEYLLIIKEVAERKFKFKMIALNKYAEDEN